MRSFPAGAKHRRTTVSPQRKQYGFFICSRYAFMRSVAESPVSMETWFMSVSCAGSASSAPCLLIKSSCLLFIIGSPPFKKYLRIAVVDFLEWAKRTAWQLHGTCTPLIPMSSRVIRVYHYANVRVMAAAVSTLPPAVH